MLKLIIMDSKRKLPLFTFAKPAVWTSSVCSHGSKKLSFYVSRYPVLLESSILISNPSKIP